MIIFATTSITWTTLAGPLVAACGVLVAFSAGVRSQRHNDITAISHCTQRYEKLMASVANARKNDVFPGSWWYAYWDLYAEEFMLFRKGLLDRDVFELWINELTSLYQKPLNSKINSGIRAEAHKTYLKEVLPHFKKQQQFFKEIDKISKQTDVIVRSEKIHSLLNKQVWQRHLRFTGLSRFLS